MINAGEGFAYVAAMRDSFPHVHALAEKILRMAAWVGTYGTEVFGEAEYPQPGAVIMRYTGLSEVTGCEPPTDACVGTNDGIAYYGTMEEQTMEMSKVFGGTGIRA